MTVYVDDARIPATVGSTKGRWSHLTADTREELHDFAKRLGLNMAWYQTCKTKCSREGERCPHWHYDVTDGVRRRAVTLGAQQINYRAWVDIIARRRAEERGTVNG